LSTGLGFGFYNSPDSFHNSAATNITFTGTLIAAPTFPPINYCGCGLLSQLGNPTTNIANYTQVTGLSPIDSGQVMRLVPGQTTNNYSSVPTTLNYTTYTFTNGAWSPSEPILAPFEAALFMVPCGPALTIAPTGNQLVLMWPADEGSFALESTTNLAAPSTWGPVTNAPSTVGSSNAVSVPISGATQFFRLKSQ